MLPRVVLSTTVCLALLAACGEDQPTDSNDPTPPSPPTDLYALPGPELDGVTLLAAPLPPASFTIYRSTSAGVTPGPATRVGANNTPGLVDRPLAAGTYFYVITASNEAGESAPSEETSILFSPGFSIVVNSPTPLGTAGDDLHVALTIVSTFELTEVSADVAGHSAALAFVPAQRRWEGIIDLRGLTHGPQRLGLAATDAQGNSVQTSIPFVYNTSPVLTVVSPSNYDVARPTVHVTATCTDDVNGCASIAIDQVDETQMVVRQLFSGSGADLDFDLSLANAAGGGEVRLRFLAFDGSDQADTVYRVVGTESPDAVLQVVATVPGRVLDVDADRILYLDSTTADPPVMKVRDRSSGGDETVGSISSPLQGRAYLTPSGAVFLQKQHDFPFSALFEWRNGTLAALGGAHDLRVAGAFAAYSTGTDATSTTLIRRNTTTGSDLTVATDISITGKDVAANGDVVYWTDDGLVWRFRDASGTSQVSPPTGLNAYPLTDGINVVYQRRTGVNPNTNGIWEIELFDGTTTTTLAPEREQSVVSPGSDYAVNNGWTAYTKPGSGGQLQVWSRSPGAEERQVSHFGTPSSVAALGANGEVVFALVGSGLFYSLPPYTGSPLDVGGQGATAFVFVGSSLYKLVGNTVFQASP
jgi:hypothetical protein